MNSTTEREANTGNGNLLNYNEEVVDLTHDIDVNFLPGVNRPTREEAQDIEVKYGDKYVPLNNILYKNEPIDNIRTNVLDLGREREDIDEDEELSNEIEFRRKRYALEPSENKDLGSVFTSVKTVPAVLQIEGLRVEESDKEPDIIDDGVPSVLADSKVTLRLFGQGLTDRTVISFTYDAIRFGEPCKFLVKGEYLVSLCSTFFCF